MPPFNRGQSGLAPWVFALAALAPVSAAWAQAAAPAAEQAAGATQASGATQAAGAAQPAGAGQPAAGALDYASQAALQMDAYLDKVILELQSASREGPAGFDLRVPQLTGPAGRPVALSYAERLTDRLVYHPRDVEFLTRDDIAAAMRGRQVQVRDGQIVITVVNPGGASAIGVAIPAADLAMRLPDAAAPGGILLFDASGRPIAVRGELTADQLGVFERFLPQKPPSLVVTETPYSVASSGRADIVVVAHMGGGGVAPEAPLPDSLFAAPSVVRKSAADPRADLLAKAAIAAPIGVGLLGGILVFLFRRGRSKPQAEKSRSAMGGMPDLPDLDYLEALSEPRLAPAAGSGSGDLALAIEGEDAVVTSYQSSEDFHEGVGEVRVLKKADAEPARAPEAAAEEAAAEEAAAEEAAGATAEAPLDELAAEPDLETPPAEVDQILADLIESTAQDNDSEAIQAVQDDHERAERAAQETAEFRGRASRLKGRLAERLDFFKTSAKGPDVPESSVPAASGPALSPPPRDVIHMGRSGAAEDPPDFRRKQKTVNPGDVLITKGEAQGLVEKESDKLLNRMQGLTREVEIRTAEALAVHRETFRELLEQFEALQENRDRDLASMHDLKNQLANEVTAATLKLKQAEAKATEGMLRLKEQMDNLTRKLEGWTVDARISEERLTGALETIREGWENQMEAHAELRKEVMRLTESMQDLGRKQEAAADREAAERRASVDQLAFEIKTVQLATENDFSVVASRLDELKSGLSTLAQRLDRAEGHQAQAIEAVYRKIEAGEALEALKQRFGRELDGLKGQLYQEMEEAMATSARGNMAYQEQIDALNEENARLSQRQHQMVQLMANLHSALGKSDARAAEEVERLKAQNAELQQMMLSMMRAGQRPPSQPGQAPHPGQGQPPRRPAQPGGPMPQPALPGHPQPPHGQPAASQPQLGQPGGPQPAAHPGHPGQTPAHQPAQEAAGQAAQAPHAAQLPDLPARPAASHESRHPAEAEEPTHEPKPIDLWSRLLGRERQPADEPTSQRKRRSK